MSKPTVYRAANLAFQLGGDKALVRRVADGADVLSLVECRDRNNHPVDIADILGDKWRVWQDTSSGERAGSVIAVRKVADIKPGWNRLLKVSDAGPGVQARYLRVLHMVDQGVPTTMGVWHNPLKSTGRQDDAMRTVKAWVGRRKSKGNRFTLSGDGNMAPAEVARQLGIPNVSGRDVMAVLWSDGWGEPKVRGHGEDGTDHKVLTLEARQMPVKSEPKPKRPPKR